MDYVRDLTKDGGKVLLTYDAYRAHISTKVMRLFRENGVLAKVLYSKTNGKLQPLDVTVFSSLNVHLPKTGSGCVTSTASRRIDMFDFCVPGGKGATKNDHAQRCT